MSNVPKTEEFKDAASLMQHYAALKNRLNRPAIKPAPAAPTRQTPVPPVVAKPAEQPVDVIKGLRKEIEAAIEVAKNRLHGAEGLSNRRKLAVLPVLEEHNVSWDDIINTNRKHHFVLARRDVYYELFKTGMSLAEIGRTCNRDHTSVLYNIKMFSDSLKDK